MINVEFAYGQDHDSVSLVEGKVKVAHEPQEAHTAGVYPGFCCMKQLRVLLLPPGWDASPLQGYLPAVCCRYPFIHLGGERQCGVKFPWWKVH